MASANVDTIRGMYEAFGRGDLPAVLAELDPRVQWNSAESNPYADGNPYVGPEAVAEGVFRRLAADWEYWKLAIDEVLDAGDNVVVTGRYAGAYKKTGAKLDAQFAHVWWLRHGKVVRFQQYVDTAQIVAVMGAG